MMWKRGARALFLTVLMAMVTNTAFAITIVFDYSYDTNGFFSDQNRKAVLEEAGSFLGNVLRDDFDPIISNDSNSFTARFTRPDTGATQEIENFSVQRDTIKIFVGARELNNSTLGHGGPGGYYVSYSSYDWYVDAITRGESPTISGVQGNDAYEFAPWGGAISFNEDVEWFFDSTPWDDSDLPGDKNDFFSVALHELAHVLGFGVSDSWERLVNGYLFEGIKSTEIYGSNPPLYSDQSHWAKDTESTFMGHVQEAAMDPSLTIGTRKYLTDLDLAALDDIGWDVAPVPVPSALWLVGGGFVALLVRRARKG